MLSRLIELKQFCMTNNQIILSSNDWNSVENMVTALDPAKIATVQMQSTSLTIGDVYGIWLDSNVLIKNKYSTIKNINKKIWLNDKKTFLPILYLNQLFI
ncbi:unnamed protein product [Macrosiphum euphorbiae]|uniref:Uncharacterized protein n=1 Tax=Macrosiphum euphorbiae TaxID=13131 RepID=A0AAV0WCU0_9HEMI|nr:unnamed protein product [Macrosiphum euphorbiae]